MNSEWDFGIAESDYAYINHTLCPKKGDAYKDWHSLRNTVCFWCGKKIPQDLLDLRNWRNLFYRKPE